MVPSDDTECSVCLQGFTRVDRIPRVLHCRHTFCTPCLESLTRVTGELLCVPCPLCRLVTVVRRCRGLQGALWVNSRVWDYIPKYEEQEEQEQGTTGEEQVIRGKVCQTPPHAECGSWLPTRTKLKLPAFLKKFSLLKTQTESAVPGGNVEMRSWRRLETDDTHSSK